MKDALTFARMNNYTTGYFGVIHPEYKSWSYANLVKMEYLGFDGCETVHASSLKELEKKVDALREASQDPENVCLAVGSSYCGLQRDIRDAMREADEDMYERKSRYYSMYPERKWR